MFNMTSKKLTRDLYLLIAFGVFRTITDLFLGAFFISFIMHLSSNEIISISTYKLFEYSATCAGFFLFANWIKRHNKVAAFGLSLLPKIIVLLSIIILGDRAVQYVIPLGLLYGISAALYHLPRHAMTTDKVSSSKMGRFVGTNNAIGYFAKIVAPVVLGCFIDTASYTEMAYVLLFFTFIEVGLVFLLAPSRHRSNTPIDFVGFYRCMARFPIIRKMFFMEILRGFGLGLLGTVITMYTVYMFKTDLNLGILTTVFSLCSVATCWLLRYIHKNKTYRIALFACIVAVLLSMLMFVCRTTPVTFLLYNFIYATAIVFMDQVNNTSIYRLSKSRCVTHNTRIEYFVFRDFALFIGRWIGFTGLMYIGVFGGYDWLRWYLIVISIALITWGTFNMRLFSTNKK
ncbi:MAG: MFS transporter [Alphaproteobacteria bacterium]|nr:MFS transporter [Alphaproteobacteria bacterium]